MKKLCCLLCFMLAVSLYSQSKKEGYHTHDGFYISPNLGWISGTIKCNEIAGGRNYDMELSGDGLLLDLKIGGTVAENLILHGTIISSAVPEPKITIGGGTYPSKDNVFIGEVTYGVGLTYYLMPANFYVSGTLGFGCFSFDNSEDKMQTDKGLSFQLKFGKEWWVSDNWGLGLGLCYYYTTLEYEPENNITDKWSSGRFSLLFSATFN